MNDEKLRELLEGVDAATALPGAREDLVGQVRRRARRRTIARRSFGGAAGVMLVVGLSFWISGEIRPHPGIATTANPHQTRSSEPRPDLARLKAEYAVLQSEADLHARTAAAMLQLESAKRRPPIDDTIGKLDVFAELAVHRDQAAKILVDRADRLLSDPAARTQATGAYQRVIELFPDSPEAAVAHERLERIGA